MSLPPWVLESSWFDPRPLFQFGMFSFLLADLGEKTWDGIKKSTIFYDLRSNQDPSIVYLFDIIMIKILKLLFVELSMPVQRFNLDGIQEQEIDSDPDTDAAVNRDRCKDRDRKDREKQFDARKIIFLKSLELRLMG